MTIQWRYSAVSTYLQASAHKRASWHRRTAAAAVCVYAASVVQRCYSASVLPSCRASDKSGSACWCVCMCTLYLVHCHVSVVLSVIHLQHSAALCVCVYVCMYVCVCVCVCHPYLVHGHVSIMLRVVYLQRSVVCGHHQRAQCRVHTRGVELLKRVHIGNWGTETEHVGHDLHMRRIDNTAHTYSVPLIYHVYSYAYSVAFSIG